ncbi:HlyD family secretion protein [Vulgatibacter incomptus]|uniref:Multidrug resistance protein A n=1 Tax=Vulgatibacter incomptus TaxID=1391653 RepID=A0A0K1PCV8_9BACT|nr:HlyD family secretion protein [Vulgatibacter incomptus]AKU91337.1 Multidrug resistance protein A [Vulgatibacter incomptus]
MSSALAIEPSPANGPSAVPPPPPRNKSKLRNLGFGAAVGLALVAALGWFLLHRGLESTDDAQVDADIVSVPARTSGVVVALHFVENQAVKAGDLLVELDPDPARARLAQAEATLEAAKATAAATEADERVVEAQATGGRSLAQASLQGARVGVAASRSQIAEGEAQIASATAARTRAESDLERARALFAKGALSKANVDRATTAFDTAAASLDQARAHLSSLQASAAQASSRTAEAAARLEQSRDVDSVVGQARARASTAHAQVAVAQAARDLAALELAYTRIVAPHDGVISKKTVAVGQMLSAGQPIGQLVDLDHVWVTANFKETQLSEMRPGQHAKVSVDAFPGVELTGAVESLAAVTGARVALLPPDNASGNFTKVVQRVPVRVRLDGVPSGLPLRPGMNVDLTVDTRG